MDFDDSDFQNKISDYAKGVVDKRMKAVRDIATEILRRSQILVPHDKGTLQNSGNVEDRADESIVGYHTPYAARLHENPQFNFQKGREGKYLEKPIKTGMPVYRKILQNALK